LIGYWPASLYADLGKFNRRHLLGEVFVTSSRRVRMLNAALRYPNFILQAVKKDSFQKKMFV
jgi:hypothetical protein